MKIEEGMRPQEQPRHQNRQALGLAISAQGRQLPEQPRLRNKDKPDATKIEQDMWTSEKSRHQTKDELEVKINVDDKQSQEQHNGHLWKVKRSNTIQQKAMTVIRSCLLDE
jgi:hypothetical protein